MFMRQSAPPPLQPGSAKAAAATPLRSGWPSSLPAPATTDEMVAPGRGLAPGDSGAGGPTAEGALSGADAGTGTSGRTILGGNSGTPRSVISNDLTISGHQLRIVSKSTLQVDGAIEGDVQGAEVVIGQLGRVTGTVIAEKVTVQGQVDGTIRGVQVDLMGTARVDGEIIHQMLSIDREARFEGTVRRAEDSRALLGEQQT